MLTAILAAPLMLAQAATANMVDQQYETREVAFDLLVAGEAEEALRQLEAELEANPGDPALLINLGTAHSQLGNLERAEAYYRAALQSDEEYRLELADGRWIDSRDAARSALANVEFEAFAAR